MPELEVRNLSKRYGKTVAVELLPGDIGDYFPAQAVGSLHGLPESTEEGLGQVAGGLVLAAWSGALVLVRTLLIRHRDLNE